MRPATLSKGQRSDWASERLVVCAGQAMHRLRARLRQILHRGNVASWAEVREELNRTLRGWENYFSYGSVGRAYEAVNWAVLERARYFLRKRHRVSTQTMWRRFSAPVIYEQYGVHQLRRRKRMPTPWAVV